MAATTEERPAAIRAFLIADVRGYTSYTLEHGDEAAARLAAGFAEVMSEIARRSGGELLELRGDEALLVFDSPRQAMRAALAAQAECRAHSERTPDRPLRVGVGIDVGEAVPALGGFRGRALNLAARLCSLAGPGEVLASEAVTHLAGRIEEGDYQDRGLVELKGFREPVSVVEVLPKPAAAAAAVPPRPRAVPAASSRVPLGAYLGALPSTLLAGRDPEVAELRERLETARGGEGRLVLLAGEPGAGKTRLAQEAFLLARNRGFLLGTGSCLETREGVPYYPFLDLLPALVEAGTSRLGGNPTERWRLLSRFLSGAAPAQGGGQAEEDRVRREVTGFIAALAAHQPVGVFIDDLHWADDSTLRLLDHLARHTRDAAVLLVGSYRDVELGRQHSLERTLRELRRDELVTTVQVRRLAEAGTAALVAASFDQERVSEEFAGLIHNQTEGNPFFIQQVLRVMVDRGDVYREDGVWQRHPVAEIQLPESIRSTIGERVSRLPAAAQEALATASVLGQPFRFDDLGRLSRRDEDALEADLGAGVEAGLVRTEDGEMYSFDHALTQATLMAEVPPRRRRRLHGEAADVLAARADAETLAAEIALHLVAADRPLEAARWSIIAASNAAAIYAHPETEKHYRTAQDLAEEAGEELLATEAMAGRGEALRALGRQPEAETALVEAARRFRRLGRPDDEAAALAALAAAAREQSKPLDTIPLIEEFLGRATPVGKRAEARLLAALGRLYWQAGRTEQGGETARRAADLAAEVGDFVTRVNAQITIGNALSDSGRFEAARDLLEQAVADIADQPDLAEGWVLANNLAVTYYSLGDFRRNLEFRERALAQAEKFALPDSLAFAATMVGQAHVLLGEFARAEPARDLAAAGLKVQAHGGRAFLYWLVHEGWASLQLGRLGIARTRLEELDASSKGVRDIQLDTWAGTVWTELLIREGRPSEAVEVMRPRVAQSRERAFRPAWPEAFLAWAELEAGNLDAAEPLAVSSTEDCRRNKEAAVLIDAARFLGMVRSAQADWPAAEAAFAESLRLAERAPWPVAAAWTRIEMARSLWARGDDRRARQVYGEAVRTLAAVGAEPTGFWSPGGRAKQS